MSYGYRTTYSRSRFRTLAAAAGIVAAAGIFVVAAPANAHDPVTAYSPGVAATISEPLAEVSITFAEPPIEVDGARIGLDVLDPTGVSVATGETRVDGATLVRSIATTVQGDYTVLYQSVASDGHTTSGEYHFTFAGPVAVVENPAAGTSVPIPGGPITAQPSTTAEAPIATESADPTPLPSSDASEATPSGSATVGMIIGAIVGGLVIIGAVITIIVAMRRRNAQLPPGA